ncbi:MAG: uroporphyrinogen decarboxylase family protein [Kiritimatiellia bacterium]|nr:hypothetical protein [Lentisphaerota bacterium]
MSNQTPRDRLLKAFAFEETAPIPYTVWYDDQTRERLNAHYGDNRWEKRIDNHILRLIIEWEPKTPVEDGHYRDIHGSIWQSGATPHIVRPVLAEPELQDFTIPDYVPYLLAAPSPPAGPHLSLPRLGFNEAREIMERERGRRLVIVQICHGLFECSWMIRGFENLFVDLLESPDFCHRLFDMLLERHLQLVDELLKLPCDGIIFVDDYGDQRGIIIGPDLWRAFIKPRLAKLYERVHQAGKWTFQHSCGNVFDIIPDLLESGLDVLQSLQPEAMDISRIKREFGHDLRLWGGVGTQQLLPQGTPDEIRAEVRRLKDVMGAGGGFCLSTSKPIMGDVPVANAATLIEETLAP